MGKFKFGDLVRSKIDGLEFKVVAISKVGNAFYYLHKSVWLNEEMVENQKNQLQAPPVKAKYSDKNFVNQAANRQNCLKTKKLFAYRNNRSTKITHYEYEWAGNQFATRCPENDIARHS